MDIDTALQVVPGLTLRSFGLTQNLLIKHRYSISQAAYLPFEVASVLSQQPDLPLQALNLNAEQALALGLKTNLAYPEEKLLQEKNLDYLLRRTAMSAQQAYDVRQLWGIKPTQGIDSTFEGYEQLTPDLLPYVSREALEQWAKQQGCDEEFALMCRTYLGIQQGQTPSPQEISEIRNSFAALQTYARYSTLEVAILLEETQDNCRSDLLLNPHYNLRLKHFLDIQHPYVLRQSLQALGISRQELHRLIEWVGPQDNAEFQNHNSLAHYQDYFAQNPLPFCDGLFMLRVWLNLDTSTPTFGPTYPHLGFFRYGPKEDVLRAAQPLLGINPAAGVCRYLDILALREDIDHQSLWSKIFVSQEPRS